MGITPIGDDDTEADSRWSMTRPWEEGTTNRVGRPISKRAHGTWWSVTARERGGHTTGPEQSKPRRHREGKGAGARLGFGRSRANLATGPREGWRESACGRDGVELGLCGYAGWATRPKIERGKGSSIFSFHFQTFFKFSFQKHFNKF